jgi:hypothetical protein
MDNIIPKESELIKPAFLKLRRMVEIPNPIKPSGAGLKCFFVIFTSLKPDFSIS